jgi:hypothetical protein
MRQGGLEQTCYAIVFFSMNSRKKPQHVARKRVLPRGDQSSRNVRHAREIKGFPDINVSDVRHDESTRETVYFATPARQSAVWKLPDADPQARAG